MELDVIESDNPGDNLASDSQIDIVALVRIIGSRCVGVILRQTGMTEGGDIGDREFVDVIADYTELHRAHRTVVAVVVVTVVVEVVAVVTLRSVRIGAGLIDFETGSSDRIAHPQHIGLGAVGGIGLGCDVCRIVINREGIIIIFQGLAICAGAPCELTDTAVAEDSYIKRIRAVDIFDSSILGQLDVTTTVLVKADGSGVRASREGLFPH